MKLNLKVFYFFVIFSSELAFAQEKNLNKPTVTITPSVAVPTCQPTVINGPALAKYPFQLIRSQDDWDFSFNLSRLNSAPIDFTKYMLVIIPYSTPGGNSGVRMAIKSACVFSDHIRVEYYFYGGWKVQPVNVNRITHKRAIGVVLPQSSLPIDVTAVAPPVEPNITPSL